MIAQGPDPLFVVLTHRPSGDDERRLVERTKPGVDSSSPEVVAAIRDSVQMALLAELLATGWRAELKERRRTLEGALRTLEPEDPEWGAEFRRRNWLFRPADIRRLGLTEKTGPKGAWASEKNPDPEAAHNRLRPFFSQTVRREIVKLITSEVKAQVIRTRTRNAR